uniref:Uncharacterized protein n=1 Tax=Entomoneis paludosa TaxID=265537 RepID=A0A7S2YHX6_9STRA|mmetsp:Transcript_33829/g.70315  ORF Transcript_33829/g.70315 Transcript_33829/m.70315 type:complete len:295 (+) Transcript_33829:374-1258(+)|eukprot:CAMPEP_0172463526 /NCGR_PEP_ID=MMETSP1065-20121228/47517_1 /TAXON_ID=265537 /ORGANISM="Amphiprora paludosa, Strain CCMP125" /LENGTH=294 /DNA_ID=CAMNT_0013219499 /DNA_START=324 /DNA_END=1208 /DNA_ORIENTATION=+
MSTFCGCRSLTSLSDLYFYGYSESFCSDDGLIESPGNPDSLESCPISVPDEVCNAAEFFCALNQDPPPSQVDLCAGARIVLPQGTFQLSSNLTDFTVACPTNDCFMTHLTGQSCDDVACPYFSSVGLESDFKSKGVFYTENRAYEDYGNLQLCGNSSSLFIPDEFYTNVGAATNVFDVAYGTSSPLNFAVGVDYCEDDGTRKLVGQEGTPVTPSSIRGGEDGTINKAGNDVMGGEPDLSAELTDYIAKMDDAKTRNLLMEHPSFAQKFACLDKDGDGWLSEKDILSGASQCSLF